MATDKVVPLMKDPIQEAIKQLNVDAGALFEPAILDALRRMRQHDKAGFARVRAAVKETKVLRMVDFDMFTAPAPEEGEESGSIFEEVSPWPEPVDGAELLDDIVAAYQRHVITEKETLQAAALWVMFTWMIDVVQIAPIANITAPEKRCGKSELLAALGRLVYQPLPVSNISSAPLFRCIELWRPTLLIDEVDAFLRENEEARGILNAGFSRDAAFVIRCVGDDHIPTRFNVWGAKALCGIGKIADTLADRSIPLRMRRAKPGERAERLRHSDPKLWADLRSRIARFAQDNREAIGSLKPTPIQGLNDRANDCWEPLLAVAEQAGGHWPKTARYAAIALHGLEGEAPSVGVELLADIKAVFDDKKVTKIFSATLLDALVADDEAPWATWNRGKPMTGRQLAGRLAEFGIKSGTVRQGFDTKKGFSIEQFRDAFDRYLSGGTPVTSVTPSQPSNHAGYSVSQSVTPPLDVTDADTSQATDDAGCDGVTDRTPPSQQGTEGVAAKWDDSDEEPF